VWWVIGKWFPGGRVQFHADADRSRWFSTMDETWSTSLMVFAHVWFWYIIHSIVQLCWNGHHPHETRIFVYELWFFSPAFAKDVSISTFFRFYSCSVVCLPCCSFAFCPSLDYRRAARCCCWPFYFRNACDWREHISSRADSATGRLFVVCGDDPCCRDSGQPIFEYKSKEGELKRRGAESPGVVSRALGAINSWWFLLFLCYNLSSLWRWYIYPWCRFGTNILATVR
jgi:hypothetical protein